MKLRLPPPRNTYDVLTKRWGLSNAELLRQSQRASVYKVDSPMGPAAFKLYTEIGYANERAAVSFSNALPPGIGARIFKSDFRRAALLIEWLSGPPLADTYHAGNYEAATRHACEVTRKIRDTRFRWAFAYRRLHPLLKQRIRAKIRGGCSAEDRRLLKHALTLLDRHFGDRGAEHVIHGDLHYANIIMTQDGPRAIDPKGISVHPIFECRNFFGVPKSETTLQAYEHRILHQLAIISEELGHGPKLTLQFLIAHMIPGLTKPGLTAEDIAHRRDRIDMLMRLEAAQ